MRTCGSLTDGRAATARGPGRVNLIGEHTDYNGGLALPFPIAAGCTVRAEAIDGLDVVAVAEDLGEEDRFPLADVQPAEGWRAFVRGMVAELARAGFTVRPARVTISADVPRGGGLSSSAALEVALALAWLALSGEEDADRVELARLCSRVENEWVGAETGLLDQLASLLGEPGRAVRLDMRTFESEPVELELGGHVLALLDSGAPHELARSGYNERRAECRRAAELLGVESLRDAANAAGLPDPLGRRVRHVITENQRVDAAVEALRERNFEALGWLLDASHRSLRDDYEVSEPDVERTVAACHDAGALGARIMGGGFGGAVLALFGPGTTLPHRAVPARPGPGARLLPT